MPTTTTYNFFLFIFVQCYAELSVAYTENM